MKTSYSAQGKILRWTIAGKKMEGYLQLAIQIQVCQNKRKHLYIRDASAHENKRWRSWEQSKNKLNTVAMDN